MVHMGDFFGWNTWLRFLWVGMTIGTILCHLLMAVFWPIYMPFSTKNPCKAVFVPICANFWTKIGPPGPRCGNEIWSEGSFWVGCN